MGESYTNTPKYHHRKSCKIHTRFDLHSATAFGGAAGLIDFVLQTGIDKGFRSQDFGANQAAQALKPLAYNLLLLYKHAALHPAYRQWTPGRLRRRLLFLPGILVSHARQWTVRLPEFAKRLSAQMLQTVP